MKGSHDSLTAYRLRNWWLYPLIWLARTQSKNIEQQYAAGVRYFDLRFRNIGGKLYGAHGFFIFNITAEEVFNKLAKCKNDVYFRVLLEDAILKDDISLSDFCEKIHAIRAENLFPANMHMHCIGRKSKWSELEYLCCIPFYGKNDYSIFQIKSKIEEMRSVELKPEPSAYECYSYKILIPRLFSGLMRRKAPENSMRNYI